MTHARTTLAPILVTTLALASPVMAAGESLALRVVDPPVVSFDSTALGRATHPLRLLLTNQSTQTMAVEPLVVHFRPMRDGVVFSCDEPRGRDDRWPASLEPGATFTFAREVPCETPLPGRYDVEISARPRSAPGTQERVLGSFPLVIEPGANPPVRLPADAWLYGAASGTKDMRPTKDPNGARIVIAVINGSHSPATLTPLRATIRVTRHGSSIPACPERSTDLAFNGTLAPGRARTLATPLGCDISVEATYDVDVTVANGSGRVKLATHPIRVRVNAPAAPGPQDGQKTPFVSGGGT